MIPGLIDTRARAVVRQKLLHSTAQPDLPFEIGTRLLDRVLDITTPIHTVLEIGTGCGALRALVEANPHLKARLGDAEGCAWTHTEWEACAPHPCDPAQPVRALHDETLPPGSYDLIISNLAFHQVNDLPGLLAQIGRALNPGGFVLASMFGAGTLRELYQALTQAEIELTGGASPRILPLASPATLGDLLQRAGLTLPVVDHDTLTMSFKSPEALMHGLRNMGEVNILQKRIRHLSHPRLFQTMDRLYRQSFSNPDGTIKASFVVSYLHGARPSTARPSTTNGQGAEDR